MGSGLGDAAGGIGAMRDLFGRADKNATNDVLNGHVVATGTPGATTQADPNQGLSGGQMFGRKAIAGALSGAGKGMQQQQPGGGYTPIQITQTPQVDPNAGNPFAQNRQMMPKGPKPSAFFGGQ